MRNGFREVMRLMKDLREGREKQRRWMEEMRVEWERERDVLSRLEKVEKRSEGYERSERKE